MGGTLAVTIREANGIEHRMWRWTNALPYFTDNIKFIEKDEEHLKDYLKTFYDMLDDYNRNKDTEAFEQFMTPAYAPGHGSLAPCGYGLVVIDYKTSTILSLQGYTAIGKIIPSNVSMAVRKMYSDGEELKRLNELFDNNKITSYNTTSDEIIPFDEDINFIAEEVEKRFKGKKSSLEHNIWNLIIDMHPWKVIEFEESTSGLKDMKKRVENLGFKLTEEDEQNWKEFIKGYEECDY